MTPWRDLVDFAETMPERPRARARAIRETFKMSTGRFWYELFRAIDTHTDEALRYSPQTVAALIRMRERNRLIGATRGAA